MIKHVIVERPREAMLLEFEKVAVELNWYLHDRGWRTYKAWRAVAGENDEPPLFDLGFLRVAATPDRPLATFECEYESRAEMDAQLAAMRRDPEVLKLIMRAAGYVEPDAGRSYVFETWSPPPPPGRSLKELE